MSPSDAPANNICDVCRKRFVDCECDYGAGHLTKTVDPVCLFHGRRWSEHRCLYCCICFEDLTPETCWVDGLGQKWDMCQGCGEHERAFC